MLILPVFEKMTQTILLDAMSRSSSTADLRSLESCGFSRRGEGPMRLEGVGLCAWWPVVFAAEW
jgi:hypothetical protein